MCVPENRFIGNLAVILKLSIIFVRKGDILMLKIDFLVTGSSQREKHYGRLCITVGKNHNLNIFKKHCKMKCIFLTLKFLLTIVDA